ncbi:MAG: SMC family ATPase, partial [Actinomycetota bacterium]|nr:SMC family ATPase [Actinomycetota bacterium]
ACVEALSETRAQLRRVDEALAKAAALRADRDAQVKQAAVAKSLAAHLDARGFEGWLLDEALELLLVGASATLQQLSAGQYSLAVDDKRRFQVVDHRNADELRPAKTLSGGETFLASLALALALADQLADLAAHGAARLEAIFLDEGFGTLDPETLDTVAAAVEELGARGRIVGLVTHVRDLAERMPVRFEVHKGPAGSGIRRQVA